MNISKYTVVLEYHAYNTDLLRSQNMGKGSCLSLWSGSWAKTIKGNERWAKKHTLWKKLQSVWHPHGFWACGACTVQSK